MQFGTEADIRRRGQRELASPVFCFNGRNDGPPARRPYVLRGIERMAQYRLHCQRASGHSYKVALYLNCAGLDWEPVFVDFFKGATRDPKWRESVNEMGEAPVLEGMGKQLTQSGVILLYLAEMTDKFAPTERRNDLAIMSAPTQVGGLGDGDTEIGAALSSGESGPDGMMEMMQTK